MRHVNGAGRQLCRQGCPLLAVMEDGKPRQAHVYLHHKDGQRVPVTVRGQALRDPDGEIVGSVEVFSNREVNPYAGKGRNRKDDSLDSVTGLGIEDGWVGSWRNQPRHEEPTNASPSASDLRVPFADQR